MKHTLILGALLMAGCVSGPGIYPTAMDNPGRASFGRNPGVVSLSSYDRDLLRIGKENYEKYRGVSGWDRGLFYTGRIRVYRWGAGAEQPLFDYAWNDLGGERWHVVRECYSGVPGLTIGTGMSPVKGYHHARELTLTTVGPAMRKPAPAPAQRPPVRWPDPDPVEEIVPRTDGEWPPLPKLELPALTQN